MSNIILFDRGRQVITDGGAYFTAHIIEGAWRCPRCKAERTFQSATDEALLVVVNNAQDFMLAEVRRMAKQLEAEHRRFWPRLKCWWKGLRLVGA